MGEVQAATGIFTQSDPDLQVDCFFGGYRLRVRSSQDIQVQVGAGIGIDLVMDLCSCFPQ